MLNRQDGNISKGSKKSLCSEKFKEKQLISEETFIYGKIFNKVNVLNLQ